MGGQLGLFAGMSVLTVFELAEACLRSSARVKEAKRKGQVGVAKDSPGGTTQLAATSHGSLFRDSHAQPVGSP